MILTEHNWKKYILLRKDKSLFMRFLGLFKEDFMTEWWTTWRWPFCKTVKIYYPVRIEDPLEPRYRGILMHEEVHAKDLTKFGVPILFLLGYILFPLPFIFSGRWFIERRAFLADIRNKRRSIKGSVWTIWLDYAWPWPKFLMLRWFKKEMKNG